MVEDPFVDCAGDASGIEGIRERREIAAESLIVVSELANGQSHFRECAVRIVQY